MLRAWERRLGSQRTMADRFGVSLACVENVLRQHRATGAVAPKPHAGGQRPRLGAAAQAVVQRLMGAHAEATVVALCTGVAAEPGVRGSVPARCRVLRRLGLPRHKRRSTPARQTPRAPSRHGRATGRRSRRSPPRGSRAVLSRA